MTSIEKYNKDESWDYTPLSEPIPITEHEWPNDIVQFVSARVLTYNHEPYIRECIEGILMQKTTFPVKIVVYEDCSTDKTAIILQEYKDKHPKLFHLTLAAENTWGKPNRKEAKKPYIEESNKAKYIAFCEGDDYWTDPMKLQNQVEFLEDNPTCAICGHGVKTIFQNNREAGYSRVYSKPITSFYKYLRNETPELPTLSLMYRVDVWLDRPKLNLAYGDVLIKLHCAAYGGVGYINKIMGAFRSHSQSFTQTDPVFFKTKRTENLIKLQNHFHEYKDIFEKKIIRSRVDLGIAFLYSGDKSNYKNAIMNHNYSLKNRFFLIRQIIYFKTVYALKRKEKLFEFLRKVVVVKNMLASIASRSNKTEGVNVN